MKEILEKFGLSEFFAYICPGMLSLFSLTLWKWPDFNQPFWNREVLAAISILILSYTLGLILASLNHIAWTRYPRSTQEDRSGFLRKIRANVILFLLYHFPPPRSASFTVEAGLRITEDLVRLSGGLMQLSDIGSSSSCEPHSSGC